MGKKTDADERLRRLGRASYGEIMTPEKRAPIPERMERRLPKNTRAYAGIEFAREPLSTREIQATIGARSRTKALQHIVASRTDDPAENGRVVPPWQYRVVARCKANLRRAAIKAERQFLDLAVCPKCWKIAGNP